MGLLTENSSHTWQPTMTSNTTTTSYWLNWRFLLCALWILTSMVVAALVIRKYEGSNKSRNEGRGENQRESAGTLYEDEAWQTCLKGIHPAWLLSYRVIAFLVLLGLIIGNAVADGGGIFYFYTQWTFTLLTIYFGLGSSLSIYGYNKKHKNIGANMTNNAYLDAEQGIHVSPSLSANENISNLPKNSDGRGETYAQKTAGVWGYIFQIIYQTSAAAVVITDCVFWFIIYPFLTAKDFSLDFFIVCMHSINAVFLLGETSLNCLRFPVFRIGYFVFWTAIFVIFHWILHAFVSMWWPYPFMDLSSSFAPIWYVAVGFLHIPCYGIFVLIVRLKHLYLSRSFPGSCQFVR